MSANTNKMNPFPGLRPFTQEEDYLFFGREEQTIELLQRLAGNRLVAVVGTSGSGKSSLVRCGLLSEVLGGATVRWDTSLRRYRFERVADAMLAAMGEERRALLEVYTEGVNAGLGALGARPPEYFALRVRPEPWRARDVLLVNANMHLGLSRFGNHELAMERLQADDRKQGVKPQKSLTEGQKEGIAELRQNAKAKLAELEILHRDQVAAATESTELAEVEEHYKIDRRRVNSDLDSAIRRLRED